MKEILNLKKIQEYLFDNKKITISQADLNAIENSFKFLQSFSKDKVIYGINTGFGPMAQYGIEEESLIDLQYNIIRSHSAGMGEALPEIYVKSALIARLNTFLQARSGVHKELAILLKDFINNNIYPFIPMHGGVGASGDLVQLAHIGLTLIGEGYVFYKNEKRNTASVLKELNLSPISMHIREGLAISNGTSVMTGIGIVNLIYAKKLMSWSIIASAMINEIADSYDDFMSEALNESKLHKGQKEIAKKMREWIGNSQCVRKREKELYRKKEEKFHIHKVQPYYSLRCTPQVLGPIYDQLKNTEEVLINEINSVSDNPIIDEKTQNIYHGGNFHGDYVSFEMDKLRIAITKLTVLAERQTNYLFHDRINGILPPFVNLGKLGLNYGLQAAQFTATSTTAECQTLSNSMYVHSIACNNDNQDIVSMGTNSSLLTKKVLDNSFQVLTILFMGLAQAIDCLEIQDKISFKSKTIYNDIREIFPKLKEDKPLYPIMEKVMTYLKEETTIFNNEETKL